MIGLMIALVASPLTLPEGQAVQASLQSCALENGRYVCRYAVPDILIVPVPGTNIVADAPATVLGSAPSAETGTVPPETLVPVTTAPMVATPVTVTPPVAPPTSPTPTAPAPMAAAEAGPIRPIDSGVLTERENQLVARCADAGWMSLCLPDDRREARTLRDKQTAYLAVRREVTRLLGEERCDAAVRTALDGGYMGLARETREYCVAPTTASTSIVPAPTTASPAQTEVAEAKAAEAKPEDEAAED
ncbi:hypothetical protein ACETK8_00145 [Brevundimonas staleyi]|uniref:DUF1311 domain-containing protein n=1 Tax=Brevundimonas staleyi TaxID=74326 RepID=A0ABW0FRA2_9CAUL